MAHGCVRAPSANATSGRVIGGRPQAAAAPCHCFRWRVRFLVYPRPKGRDLWREPPPALTSSGAECCTGKAGLSRGCSALTECQSDGVPNWPCSGGRQSVAHSAAAQATRNDTGHRNAQVSTSANPAQPLCRPHDATSSLRRHIKSRWTAARRHWAAPRGSRPARSARARCRHRRAAAARQLDCVLPCQRLPGVLTPSLQPPAPLPAMRRYITHARGAGACFKYVQQCSAWRPGARLAAQSLHPGRQIVEPATAAPLGASGYPRSCPLPCLLTVSLSLGYIIQKCVVKEARLPVHSACGCTGQGVIFAVRHACCMHGGGGGGQAPARGRAQPAF